MLTCLKSGPPLFAAIGRFRGRLDGDHLPIGGTKGAPSGNWIVDGVERNAIERVVKYWLYRKNLLDWRGAAKIDLENAADSQRAQIEGIAYSVYDDWKDQPVTPEMLEIRRQQPQAGIDALNAGAGHGYTGGLIAVSAAGDPSTTGICA